MLHDRCLDETDGLATRRPANRLPRTSIPTTRCTRATTTLARLDGSWFRSCAADGELFGLRPWSTSLNVKRSGGCASTSKSVRLRDRSYGQVVPAGSVVLRPRSAMIRCLPAAKEDQ
jgi:hypothetical protein